MQFCWYTIIPLLFDRLCKHPICILNNLVFIAVLLLSNILECLKNPDIFWHQLPLKFNRTQTSTALCIFSQLHPQNIVHL